MRNILLVGITGTGKSAAGTLLCQPDGEFVTSNGVKSCTKDPETIVSQRNNIRVTDTMGFLDTEDDAATTKLKITSALAQVKEGIHCMMFFAKFGRFTSVENSAMELMVDTIFGQECKLHLCFVLTHVSESKMVTNKAEQEKWLKDQLKNYSGDETHFGKMYEMCGRRVVFVSNPPIDEDEDAERINKKYRDASRNNLFQVINSMDETKVYLPEVARKVQAEYEAKLKKMEEDAKREVDEAKRKVAEEALANYKATAEGQREELMKKTIESQLLAKDREIAELKKKMEQMMMKTKSGGCNLL